MNTAIDHDTLTFFCFPVYGGRIPKPMYDRMKIISGDKTPCVPVAVFGNRAVDDALLEMSELAEKCGFVTVAGCEMVAPHSIDPQFGAGRPDASDKAKLHDFLEKLKAAESFSPAKMPGDPNYASKKTPFLPLYPMASKECIGCGICTTKCEFDAIHLKRNRPQNSKMIPAEDKFKAIGPYAAKRQVKIIKKKLSGK